MIFSASSVARVIACPASAVLPATHSTGMSAERGTSIHAYMRRGCSGIDLAEAIQHVAPEYRTTCSGIAFIEITAGLAKIRSEVSYAFNAETGEVRLLGYNLDRRYPTDLALPWVPGTIDLEAERAEDGVPVVEDFKTGQPVDPAAENAQILFYALCVRAMTGASDVEGRIRYVREDGRTYVDSHVFDVFELDAFAIDLQRAAQRVALLAVSPETATVSAGSHCKYCPALSSCPQKVGLARQLLPTLHAIRSRIAEMGPVERGIAWAKIKEVESIAEEVIAGLRECAVREPTPLPDGKTLTVVESSRTSFVQADAVTLLRELGASQGQIDSLYRKSTFDVVKAIKVKKEKAA